MRSAERIMTCLLSVMLLSCAAHHRLQPAGPGNWTGSVSAGGPVIAVFDTRIPIPYLMAGATYGLGDRTNLNADFHLFPLFYKIAGLDLGAGWYLEGNHGFRPVLCIQTSLMCLASLKSGVNERYRIFPILTPSAAWPLSRCMIYSGLDWTLQMTRPDYDEEAPSTLISPFIGCRWPLGSRYHVYTELKWQAANLPTEKLAVDYWPIGGHGAVSMLMTLTRGF
jgi:hypothetical protein